MIRFFASVLQAASPMRIAHVFLLARAILATSEFGILQLARLPLAVNTHAPDPRVRARKPGAYMRTRAEERLARNP